MIFLCTVEIHKWYNLRDDRPFQFSCLIKLTNEFLRCSFLIRSMEENHRSVLISNIRSLPVLGRRIVLLKEDLEQSVVRNFVAIERQTYCFSVARRAKTYHVIGGIFVVPPAYPTSVVKTPGVVRYVSSTPQKQPAPKVAVSVDIEPY